MKHFKNINQIYSWNKSTPGGDLNIIPLELLRLSTTCLPELQNVN